jgi:membrane-associated PAP2 superfamily phosphatase
VTNTHLSIPLNIHDAARREHEQHLINLFFLFFIILLLLLLRFRCCSILSPILTELIKNTKSNEQWILERKKTLKYIIESTLREWRITYGVVAFGKNEKKSDYIIWRIMNILSKEYSTKDVAKHIEGFILLYRGLTIRDCVLISHISCNSNSCSC